MSVCKRLLMVLCIAIPIMAVFPQSSRDSAGDSAGSNASGGMAARETAPNSAELPLRRIALLSSGVGYFEHSGRLGPSEGQYEINFPFDSGAVNDALKSLVINDPASASPSVRYASQNSLERTLKSLKVDLSGAPGIGEILNGLKGAELEIAAPNVIKGRIIGVEYRQAAPQPYSPARSADEAWLSLFTPQGIKAIAVKDIASFRFIDEKINADIERALNLIMASRDSDARNLLVALSGGNSRPVSISYVIPAPVWKVSYRLDLSAARQQGQAGGQEPFLQGWAIVDNDSDTDWKDVELSLVTGRPVSFIQNLYPPYRLTRPFVPLAIAGIAESRTYESGYDTNDRARSSTAAMAKDSAPMEMAAQRLYSEAPSYAPVPAPAVGGGVIEAAAGRAAGDQFEFTLKSPVSLERRQSAMLPLVEGSVKAEKTLVFSGARAMSGSSFHPGISVELTNNSGMKLPAGPITVYDGGTYAGDALIEFFPENEKRLITYGDDLSVLGSVSPLSSRYVTGVTISGGVMTISRKQSYDKTYTIRNSSGENKKIIIEHPITQGAELAEPAGAEDRTGTLYRFTRPLPARDTLTFKVKEESPLSERITLAQLRPENFLSYSTNQEIPANVRAALERAIALKKSADEAEQARKDLETQMTRLVSEQDRIRRNLEAAGNQSPQGQEYLRRLASLDSDIDELKARIESADKETQRAKKEYENYLATINI